MAPCLPLTSGDQYTKIRGMGQTKYQITLAADGKHSVSVISDDPESVKVGLKWAKEMYQTLAGPLGREPIKLPAPEEEAAGEEDPPICQVHQFAMVRVQGKKGPFWSCHQRNA